MQMTERLIGIMHLLILDWACLQVTGLMCTAGGTKEQTCRVGGAPPSS